MKITIDTSDMVITEHPQKGDKQLDDLELEKEIAHGIAALIVGQSLKWYKTEKARRGYIQLICKLANDALTNAGEEQP